MFSDSIKNSRFDEINLLKASIERLEEERDSWMSACIDIVIFQQYGYERISYRRYEEIFYMCYEATKPGHEEPGRGVEEVK